MKLLLVMFAGMGLILIGISLPLIQRRIKPNPFYGFRVRATLENEALWYDVNEHSGWRLLIAGFVTGVVAVVLYVIPNLSLDAYAILCGGISVLATGVGLAQTARYLQQRRRD